MKKTINSVEFEKIAVLERVIGKNVASRMIRVGKQFVRLRCGSRPCITYVKKGNKRSIAFFEKQGFKI